MHLLPMIGIIAAAALVLGVVFGIAWAIAVVFLALAFWATSWVAAWVEDAYGTIMSYLAAVGAVILFLVVGGIIFLVAFQTM